MENDLTLLQLEFACKKAEISLERALLLICECKEFIQADSNTVIIEYRIHQLDWNPYELYTFHDLENALGSLELTIKNNEYMRQNLEPITQAFKDKFVCAAKMLYVLNKIGKVGRFQFTLPTLDGQPYRLELSTFPKY